MRRLRRRRSLAGSSSALRARQGFRILKIKGGIDPDEDVRRVQAVNKALPNFTLRLDADQGYSVQQALGVARALEGKLEMLEQPTPAADVDGLRQVTRHSPVPVLADESVVGPSSALEIAARRGIGPLSPQGTQVWHGFAEPCVSCGQLVKRGASECDQCGQDLSPAMLEKMRIHAGPWYVLEHVRPFPGVSLERIIRQIRRGLITGTSIVRGPGTAI